MNNCQHLHKIGDNYGLTCEDCGAQLEGYGYGGLFGQRIVGTETCVHGSWQKISAGEEQCLYCEEVRERENQAN